MNILILSCNTGGGHNSAGKAVQEELNRRGHRTVMMDPFDLAGDHVSRVVGNAYVKLVQKKPELFGVVYHLGLGVSKMPFLSPVYYANSLMVPFLEKHLKENSYDAVVMSHLFPAEIFTALKKKGLPCPTLIFIATDYTCIPFTEETECDYYVIPHKDLAAEYVRRGVSPEKLLPFGIPVSRSFFCGVGKAEARKRLGLAEDEVYFLVVGGSIGAGKIKKFLKFLTESLQKGEHVIIICGSNEKLYDRLTILYQDTPGVILIRSTSHMALYMEACDVLFSKPGGLSSTEAAVLGTPLVHISPIPGCESRNRRFFSTHGLSVRASSARKQVEAGRLLLEERKSRDAQSMQSHEKQSHGEQFHEKQSHEKQFHEKQFRGKQFHGKQFQEKSFSGNQCDGLPLCSTERICDFIEKMV